MQQTLLPKARIQGFVCGWRMEIVNLYRYVFSNEWLDFSMRYYFNVELKNCMVFNCEAYFERIFVFPF
ncbi:hypothetical protein TorRG33x02_304230 [Trema orientale]|uniref:Uncharacterized protein n=1 Tax=Trema orientale TaxID=63057 RepID=A0A2P5BY64_TREOI|nr:hypothetical protein TorRG33x02_304230 [Trema orientale]